jgi:hypothetical protein
LYLDTINQEEKFSIGNIRGTQKLMPEPCPNAVDRESKASCQTDSEKRPPYRAEEVAGPLLTAGIFLSRAVPT